jgi:hypothetical protein
MSLMPEDSEWLSIARTADADELRERILAGYKSGKPLTHYVPTVTVPSRIVHEWALNLHRHFLEE